MRIATASRSALTLAVVLWAVVAVFRYQRVETPEPLFALVLLGIWLVVFLLACLGVGWLPWRLVGGSGPATGPGLVLVVASGATCLMVAAALLSSVGLMRPVPLTVVLGSSALGGAARVLRSWRSWRQPRVPRGITVQLIVLLVVVVLTLPALPTASPFYDQLHYHLGFPFHWLRAGRIFVFEREVYSFLPADMGLLYVYALGTLGPWAAQAIHWSMGLIAVAATGALGSLLGGRRAGWWAAAFLAATPSVMVVSTWAVADLGAAAFGAVACLALLVAVRAKDNRRSRRLVGLSGVFVGVAAGCKVLALATVGIPLCALLFLASPRGWSERLRETGWWLAGATLIFAPWLIRNLAVTGNPFYPFLSGVFASPAGSAEAARGIVAGTAGQVDLLAAATLSTFHPRGDAGPIGPVFVALAPLAVWAAWRRRRGFTGALAVAALLGVVGWASGPLRGRYLLPVLTFLAVLLGVGWQRLLLRVPRMARAALLALIATVLGWNVVDGTTPLELERAACTLGKGSGEALMMRYASYWPAVRFVNRELPRNARLLLVGESRSLYLDRDIVVEDPGRTPLLVELARSATSPAGIADRLRRMGITHVLINRQEARRIAAYDGRGQYFAPLDPAAAERLQAFLARCLTTLMRENGVEVDALVGCRE
jgi:4-amino-4-deoxy-L-arabinose transferase-like glycosyltransferase